LGDSAIVQAETRVNAEHASKQCRGSRPEVKAGKAVAGGEASDNRTRPFRRGIGVGMAQQEIDRNTGSPGDESA
jgi:hypothetical protein